MTSTKVKVDRRTLKPGDLVTLDFDFHPLMKAKVIGKGCYYPGDIRKNSIRVIMTAGYPDYWRGRIIEVQRSAIRFRDLIRVRGGQYRVTAWPFDCEWDTEPVSCGISDVYYA